MFSRASLFYLLTALIANILVQGTMDDDDGFPEGG